MLHFNKIWLTSLMLIALNCSAAPEDHFVTTWKTDNPGASNNSSITIPTFGTGYSYSVDWDNDNIVDETGLTGDITHDYGAPGIYTIRILGDFPRISFQTGDDAEKIIAIEQWGTNPWTSMSGAFYGAKNLINNASDTPDLSGVNTLNNMFLLAESMGAATETANWNWDTSQILTMSQTFYGAQVFNQDINGWITAAVIDMSSMFFDASSFNQDISPWDTSNVQDMSSMFLGANNFNQDLSDWEVESVTDFSLMFSLVTLSNNNYDALLISWAEQDINNALSFSGGNSKYCSHEARVAHLSLALQDSLSIQDGGLCDEGYFTTTWKTDNPGTSGTTSITIPAKDDESYFYRVDWNGDGDFDDSGESTDHMGSATHDYGTAGTYTIKILGVFPRIYFNNGGDKDKILSVEQWGTKRFSTMGSSFVGASNLVVNATDKLKVEAGGGYFQMFKDASSIGLGSGNWDWNTQFIENMQGMFRNTQFNKDISGWDTSSVQTMASMFYDTGTFDRDLSQWIVSNVTDFSFMFANAGLSTVNYDALLTGWDAQVLQAGMSFGGGSSQYCSTAAEFARNHMINSDGWVINDSGQSTTCAVEVDLVVGVNDSVSSVEPGELVEYTIQVVNIGTAAVINANLSDVLPPELLDSTWICTPLGTATCGASGVGEINDTFSIPIDGSSSVTYTVSATVTSDLFTAVYYQAAATANVAQTDLNESNNFNDDLNVYDDNIFTNGFETALLVINANKGRVDYDLSSVAVTLGVAPHPIIKGLDDNGQATLWVHLRVVNDQRQVRVSEMRQGLWQIGFWENISVDEQISIIW